MHHNYILDTLQNLINHRPTQQELADILKTSINTIGSRAKRNSKYSLEEIKEIENFYKVDLFNKDNQNIVVNNSIDTITIDYYPDVFGSCGSGVFVLSEQKEQMEISKRLINSYSKIKSYSIINAYGDSMQPYIYDKDKLIIEFNDNEQIIDNRVYVFRLNDKIFIKRLSLNINELVIKSDNKEYNTKIIPILEADIQIIGRVVGLVRSME